MAKNNYSVKIKVDNSKKVIQLKDKAVEDALEEIGLRAVAYAKKNCPVDTGRLRNSITYATKIYAGQGTYTDESGTKTFNDATAKNTPKKSEVIIGSNVEYAEKVENNHKGKKHFLRNSATQHSDEYKKVLEKHLKNV